MRPVNGSMLSSVVVRIADVVCDGAAPSAAAHVEKWEKKENMVLVGKKDRLELRSGGRKHPNCFVGGKKRREKTTLFVD